MVRIVRLSGDAVDIVNDIGFFMAKSSQATNEMPVLILSTSHR